MDSCFSYILNMAVIMLTDGQLKSSSNIQQQPQQQTLQPGLPASTGVNTSPGTLSRARFHWSHALILVGFLTASGAGTVLIIKVLPPTVMRDAI
jgi:hypothetical protein